MPMAVFYEYFLIIYTTCLFLYTTLRDYPFYYWSMLLCSVLVTLFYFVHSTNYVSPRRFSSAATFFVYINSNCECFTVCIYQGDMSLYWFCVLWLLILLSNIPLFSVSFWIFHCVYRSVPHVTVFWMHDVIPVPSTSIKTFALFYCVFSTLCMTPVQIPMCFICVIRNLVHPSVLLLPPLIIYF